MKFVLKEVKERRVPFELGTSLVSFGEPTRSLAVAVTVCHLQRYAAEPTLLDFCIVPWTLTAGWTAKNQWASINQN